MTAKAKEALQIIALATGLSIVVFFLYFFRFNKDTQLIVGFVGCAYYSVWGIIHHASKERLTGPVIFEYLLVGLVVFLLLLLSFAL